MSWCHAGFSKLASVVRGRQRDEGKVTRRKPTPIPPEEEYPHVAVHHDDQSRRLFQDTLDLCSEADAISACRALNEKISDAILTLVDEWAQSPSLSLSRSRSRSASGLDAKSAGKLQQIIGRDLYYLIKQSRSNIPSDQLQYWVTDALHAVAVHHVSLAVSWTFCPGLPPEANRRMECTFRDMLRTGKSSH